MTRHGVHIDPASLPADGDPDRPRLRPGILYGQDVIDQLILDAEKMRAVIGELARQQVKQRDERDAEAERLRGLLRQALQGWRIDAVHARCGCHDATCSCIFGELDRIHREASL